MNAKLPRSWLHVKLGDVTEIIGGGTPPRHNPSYFGGTIPWATPTDVTKLENIWLDKTSEYITHAGLKTSSARLLPSGTVLMTSRATIGITAIATVELCTNQGFANFICDNRFVLNEYLAYWLRATKKKLISLASGTTFKEIAKSTLASIPISLPSVNEQQRIIELLREVDRLRRLRREADEKTETVLITVFNEMLGRPRDNWVEKRLGDVISDLQPGKSLNGIDKPADEEKWGVLKVSAVTSGRFRPEENKELSEHETPSEDLEVKDGDLLISRANTEELVGASAFVRNPPDRLLLPDKLWRVVLPEEPEINLLYLYALLNSPEMRIKISRIATGTSGSMKNISQENFLAIRFKMPPKYLQDELSDKIKILWDDVSGIQLKAKSRLDLLSRTILSRAFTGELTQEWREANAPRLHTEVEERNRQLKQASFAVRADERVEVEEEVKIVRIPAGRERYAENLSEKQREMLSLALNLMGYFDVMRIYNEQDGNGKLSRAAIEQALALLAETGLLRRVRVKSNHSEDNREVFAPAIRMLREADISRLMDIGEIESELNPA